MGAGVSTVKTLVPVYIGVTVGLVAGLAGALWRLSLRFWEEIALLTIALNVLPTVSGGYKLLDLVVPIVLFLRFGTSDPWRWWYLAGFTALMVPNAYVELLSDGTNLGVVMDPLIMLAIALAIITAGLSRSDSTAPPATVS